MGEHIAAGTSRDVIDTSRVLGLTVGARAASSLQTTAEHSHVARADEQPSLNTIHYFVSQIYT